MNNQTASYVLGFMFNGSRTSVALIRKTHPAWQAGLLNGIGGKMQDEETPNAAMVREFHEESGVITTEDSWSYFGYLQGEGYVVHCFAASSQKAWDAAESITDELIEDHGFVVSPKEIVPNLSWLIPMANYALDHENFRVFVDC
jgi:8-oxo-dGTP diphosphatase